jgi:hypothetical protein
MKKYITILALWASAVMADGYGQMAVGENQEHPTGIGPVIITYSLDWTPFLSMPWTRMTSRLNSSLNCSIPMHEALHDFFGLAPEKRVETFEGVGDVETLVFYPQQLPVDIPGPQPAGRASSALERFGWRLRISWAFILETLGLHKSGQAFHNLPA